MTENNPTTTTTTTQSLADEIVRRDRNRVRVLAALTVTLWVIVGLLIPAIYLPFAAKVIQTLDHLDRATGGGQPVSAAQLVREMGPLFRYSVKVSMVAFGLAIIGAMLVSITSVALALTIRRATLRQVSANLADISELLRRLKTSP